MSWQLRALRPQLRYVVKQCLRRTPNVAMARVGFDLAAGTVFRPVPFSVHQTRPGGLHWVRSGPVRPDRVVLYFHGGGYIVGGPHTHSFMLARLSRLTGLDVCVPKYRLAPETPFPGAFDDACRAWRALQALGYRPGDIVLGGDSAGGGLALALLAWVCARGEQPAGCFGLSPWTDLTLSGASHIENAGRDMMFPKGRSQELTRYYLQSSDARDPRASPLFADFVDPPPVEFHCAQTEILRDDTLRMAQKLRDQGGRVTVFTRDDAPHVWHLFQGWLPEANHDLRGIARFVQSSLDDTSR